MEPFILRYTQRPQQTNCTNQVMYANKTKTGMFLFMCNIQTTDSKDACESGRRWGGGAFALPTNEHANSVYSPL